MTKLFDYMYYGIPPKDRVYYLTKPGKKTVVVDDFYDYLPYLKEFEPKPNPILDDQIVNQITYRILTTILMEKPHREVEISPITKIRFNL